MRRAARAGTCRQASRGDNDRPEGQDNERRRLFLLVRSKEVWRQVCNASCQGACALPGPRAPAGGHFVLPTGAEKVMSQLEQFADILEQASIDEAFLDCSKSAAADRYEYAAKIKVAIKERCGLRVSIGIAPSRSIAKIASDFKKPEGLMVVNPQDVEEFLAPLEVGRISGIGPKTRQTLKKIGIETIGQLATCNVQKLTDRFGRNGLWMWRVANGLDDEAVQPREDNVSLSTEHTLDKFTCDKDRILVYLNELVDEIYGRLVRRGYTFRTVGVKLVRVDFTIETRETSFPDMQAKRESISSVIEQLLGRFSFDDRAPAVRKVGLKVTNLISAHEEENQIKMQKKILDYVSMPLSDI